MKIILASTSKYRAELIQRLGFPFETCKPSVDEEQLKNQLLQKKVTPLELAETLSQEKGKSVLQKYPESIIISGDQLVSFDNEILGKPHTFEMACKMLERMQGKTHDLITATTLIINSKIIHNNNIARMTMKSLTSREIQSYVELDNPLDCAGSIKIEKHGISLFEKIECDDFSAIQGLPLIWLSNTLQRSGYELFKK